jgi:hypothetical protein
MSVVEITFSACTKYVVVPVVSKGVVNVGPDARAAPPVGTSYHLMVEAAGVLVALNVSIPGPH